MNKTPHRCPVCFGYKTVSKPPHIAGDQLSWSSNGFELYPCPACAATGIVWEPLENDPPSNRAIVDCNDR